MYAVINTVAKAGVNLFFCFAFYFFNFNNYHNLINFLYLLKEKNVRQVLIMASTLQYTKFYNIQYLYMQYNLDILYLI